MDTSHEMPKLGSRTPADSSKYSPDYGPARSPDYGPPETPLPTPKQIIVNTDKSIPIVDPASLDAIGIFYKLKGKYEHDFKKLKSKILNRDDLTMDEKRDLFQTQKPKCINCKKAGGTIFKVEPERYLAMCNCEEKCKLDIKIKRGKISQLNDYVRELRTEHKKLVTSIMQVKYNLLFKYANEEETVRSFEKEKGKFETITLAFDLYKTKLIEITNLLSKKETINVTDLQIFEFIKEIKEMVIEAKTDSNPQFLKDSVELYITRLMDVLKENRENKYSYQSIEKGDNGEYNLVQKPVTIEDLEVLVGDSFKVETLILNK